MKRLTGLIYAVLTAFSEAEAQDAAEDFLILQTSARPHKSAVKSLAFSPDSTLLAAGGGIEASLGGWGVLNLFEVKSMTLLHSFRDYETPVLAAAFASDGKAIAAGGFPVIVWELPSGKMRLKLKPPSTVMSLIYISDQDKMITTSYGQERAAVVWDTKEGVRLTTLDGDSGSEAGKIYSLDITRNGKLLATGGPGRYATIWDCKTWTAQKWVNTNASRGESRLVRFGASDSVLFTKGDFRIPGKIWKIQDGSLKCQLENDINRSINDAAFSPDGRLLATADSMLATPDFNGMRLWDAETGKLLHQLRGHFGAVAFSPDGKLMGAGSKEGTIFLYKVNNPTPRIEHGK